MPLSTAARYIRVGRVQTKLDSSKADLEAKTRRISELEKEAEAIKSELKVSETELQRVRAQRQKVPTLAPCARGAWATQPADTNYGQS